MKINVQFFINVQLQLNPMNTLEVQLRLIRPEMDAVEVFASEDDMTCEEWLAYTLQDTLSEAALSEIEDRESLSATLQQAISDKIKDRLLANSLAIVGDSIYLRVAN